MKVFLVLAFVGAACCYRFNFHNDFFSEAFVNYHNSRNDVSWKATTENFKNVPYKGRMDFIKSLCGAKPAQTEMKLLSKDILVLDDLPDNFDARVQWPNCPTVKEIKDKRQAGSSEAIGCVEAASDRICIQSKGMANVELSAHDIMSCCKSCGDGCNGGYIEAAWNFLKNEGVVTGGPCNSHMGCLPDDCQPCGQSKCKKECEVGYNNTYTADKHYAKTVYAVTGVQKIMTEIMANGPVEAIFTVYADFLTYKSGVYEHTSGGPLGGLAIKILGWGIEDSKDYWLVANSWGPDWGDQGYFKILRGKDECGIESNIVAGMMKV